MTSLVKPNIHLQISELYRERYQRKGVYARLIGTGRLRKSVAEYQNECLDQAIKTLEYMRDNRDVIVAAVEASKAVPT